MEEELIRRLLGLFHGPFRALREGRITAREAEESWKALICEMDRLGFNVRERIEEMIRLAYEYERANDAVEKVRIESRIMDIWAGPGGPSDKIWGCDP